MFRKYFVACLLSLTSLTFLYASEWENAYFQAKDKFAQKTGISVGANISYMAQRVAPSGKQTAVQTYYYPWLSFSAFEDTAIGTGTFDANYKLVRYWGTDAVVLTNRLGVLSPINDYSSNKEAVTQLTYTHTLPGDLDWLSATVGQFPIYFFDGTTYDTNQMLGLVNMSLSQAASGAYPLASFGGFLQAKTTDWRVLAGWQDAHNATGEDVDFHTAFDGKYVSFGYVEYAPQIDGLGKGQYTVLGYYQESVDEKMDDTKGWSLNALQDMGAHWSIFGRINGTSGTVSYTGIRQSYLLGVAYRDPFSRNELDVITLAAAYNKLDSSAAYRAYGGVRGSETVMELQWVYGIGRLLTITPDIQVYPNAGSGANKGWKTVAGIRTTFMF